VSGEHTVGMHRPEPMRHAVRVQPGRLVLLVHAAAGDDLGRIGTPQARPVQRIGDGAALLCGGASPALAHNPGRERAPSGGVHAAPAGLRIAARGDGGEMREARRGRWTLRRAGWCGCGERIGCALSSSVAPLGMRACSLEAARRSEEAAEPGLPRRLREIVRVVHRGQGSTRRAAVGSALSGGEQCRRGATRCARGASRAPPSCCAVRGPSCRRDRAAQEAASPTGRWPMARFRPVPGLVPLALRASTYDDIVAHLPSDTVRVLELSHPALRRRGDRARHPVWHAAGSVAPSGRAAAVGAAAATLSDHRLRAQAARWHCRRFSQSARYSASSQSYYVRVSR
jgi:hypothetical protein